MNYTEIIEDIKKGMTGDVKEDLPYLEQQALKYRGHKLGKQIIDEISKIAYEILPEDRKQEVNKALYHNGKRLDTIFNEAKLAADVHDYVKAAKLMKGVVESVDSYFTSTKDRDFMSFRNPLEEYMYFTMFKPENKKHKPPFNFSEFFRFYGYVLIELKKLDEAIAILDRAVKFNPVNADAYFELAEAYKLKKNPEMLYYVIKDTIRIAISSSALAKCYSNMGFYCIEIEDYESAVCFYYQSMRCEENQAIVGEMNFIRQKTGKDIVRPSDAAIEAAFEKYDMKPGANEEVINIAYSLGKHSAETNQNRFAKYCLSIVCDLTDDAEVKKLYETVEKL